jgi:3-hydroxyisobutyrate dehydrogenase-like beta-hydroxyacid dehydrogenase
MSMVPEGSHVRQVYLDETEGVLNSDLSHKLLIDFSTIDTATSLLVNERIKEKYPASSSSFYDAPVSGGPIGAENATLTVMLGCSDTDPNLPRLRELISLMGKSIVPCGGPSLGLTAKLCNNYLSGLTCIATAETYNIAIRSGLDPKLLHGIFQTSTAQNYMNDKFNPVPNVIADSPANRGYSGGFKVQLMRKDFNLAVEMAERVGARLQLGQAGLQTYTEASQDPRCQDLDSRVVYRYIGGDEEWEKRLRQ